MLFGRCKLFYRLVYIICNGLISLHEYIVFAPLSVDRCIVRWMDGMDGCIVWCGGNAMRFNISAVKPFYSEHLLIANTSSRCRWYPLRCVNVSNKNQIDGK